MTVWGDMYDTLQEAITAAKELDNSGNIWNWYPCAITSFDSKSMETVLEMNEDALIDAVKGGKAR